MWVLILFNDLAKFMVAGKNEFKWTDSIYSVQSSVKWTDSIYSVQSSLKWTDSIYSVQSSLKSHPVRKWTLTLCSEVCKIWKWLLTLLKNKNKIETIYWLGICEGYWNLFIKTDSAAVRTWSKQTQSNKI